MPRVGAWLESCQQHMHDLPYLPRKKMQEHGRSAWEERVQAGRYGYRYKVHTRLLEAEVAAGIIMLQR